MKFTLSTLLFCSAVLASPFPGTQITTPMPGKKFRIGLQSQQQDRNCQNGKCVEYGWGGLSCLSYEKKCETFIANNWFTYWFASNTEPMLCTTDPNYKNFLPQGLAVDQKSPFEGYDMRDVNKQPPPPHLHVDLGWCRPGASCYYEANGEDGNYGILMIDGKANSCSLVKGDNKKDSDPLFTSKGGACGMMAARRNMIECSYT